MLASSCRPIPERQQIQNLSCVKTFTSLPASATPWTHPGANVRLEHIDFHLRERMTTLRLLASSSTTRPSLVAILLVNVMF